MSTTIHRAGAPIELSATRDDEWHREYAIVTLVKSDDPLDGPAVVMATSGLYLPGASYSIGNDADLAAFVYPGMKVAMYKAKDGENSRLWRVEQKASTKPLKRCMDEQFDDPLLMPDRLSGTFVKDKEEIAYDRFGQPVLSSSWEMLRGSQVEFPRSKHTVKIEQNSATLDADIWMEMVDGVNEDTLWGFARRCVMLTNITWEEKWYGTCSKYYTRTFDFEIDKRTHDRDALDEGTKVLNGHWATDSEINYTGTGSDPDPDGNLWVLDRINGELPDPANPAHFCRYKDRAGENARVVLDGHGQPFTGNLQTGTGTGGGVPGRVHIEKAEEYNFLLLGIPSSIGP